MFTHACICTSASSASADNARIRLFPTYPSSNKKKKKIPLLAGKSPVSVARPLNH
ncbi:hypothetical protein ACSS6W_008547 [Trichoderma asperelloides]